MSRGSRAGKGRGKGGAPARGAGNRASNGVDYTGASKSGCSSGKWAWPDDADGRKRAKTLVKALRKCGGKAVRAYICPECKRWHVGHLPFETRRGHRSTRDIYGSSD